MKQQFIYLLLAAIALMACNKTAFLDAKPNSSLVVPHTLQDFQAMLVNQDVFNPSPDLGELSADNYYLPVTGWNAISVTKDKNAYIWAPDIYEGKGNIFDWNIPFKQVFYANIVLEGLAKLPSSTGVDEANGTALFLRAFAYHNLVSLYAPAFDSATATTDMGLPIRTSSDINVLSPRASVAQTYDFILNDLKQAVTILPVSLPPALRNQPSKPAAYALLARVYLSMRLYKEAGLYADSCLQLYDHLINYNNINSGATYPFTRNNDEVLYQAGMATNQPTQVMVALLFPNTVVDSTLFKSYASNDLRRTLYFTTGSGGNTNVRPGYTGISVNMFSGLATDEVYLIRAECYARAGNKTLALSDLNTLLKNRFVTGTFQNITTANASEAVQIILAERRKELCFRGLRWSDLKRLNKEGANIVLTRVLGGTRYTLPPNSPLYVLPIPPDEITLGGVTQNPR